MPVMPAFSAFAPKPNLAQSFLGGAELSANIAQHAQQIQIQREKLAAEAQQAEMELLAKKEAAHSAQLRQQQEMEMEKAYKQAQMGLQERNLADSQKLLELKAQDASRKMIAQQQYQKRFGELSATMPPEEASRRAILEINPALFGGAGTAAVKPPTSPMDFGDASELMGPGGKPTGMLQAQSGVGSRRIFAPPTTEAPVAKPIAGTEDYMQIGKQIVRKPDPVKSLKADLKALEKVHEKDIGKNVVEKESKGTKLTPEDKRNLDRYRKQEREIEKLDAQIEALRSRKGSAEIPGGSKTNKIGRFTIIQ